MARVDAGGPQGDISHLPPWLLELLLPKGEVTMSALRPVEQTRAAEIPLMDSANGHVNQHADAVGNIHTSAQEQLMQLLARVPQNNQLPMHELVRKQ